MRACKRTRAMRVGHALVAASIAGAAGLAVAYAVRKVRSMEEWSTGDGSAPPPTWVSFTWNLESEDEIDSGYDDDDVCDEQALREFDDSSSCQTEKQFISELEQRVASARLGARSSSSLESDVASVGLANVNALTVWEYRDLFAPTRKVDIKLYEEYYSSLHQWTGSN